ncbi:Las1-like-domain-containing protein [Halenospora varia]|nr:Las1-like-domain-containing protein [Halenospora varia]
MVQYVITPWRNRAELLRVREMLYTPSSKSQTQPQISHSIHNTPGKRNTDENRKYAVELVSVWMQRGNCPHLVESTALLTAACLNDQRENSTYCVRAAYASAFCRFVTGLLDSHQTKLRKQSMYSIAKSIGLPATYVELRHQATHEELPSLTKLRSASQKALRWIWENYWKDLEAGENSRNGGEDECKAFVQRLVRETDEDRRNEMMASLEEYREEELLQSLLEVQWTERGAGVLLRAIELQKKILKGSSRSASASATPKKDKTAVGSLDDVRREMEEMQRGLENVESEIEGEEEEDDEVRDVRGDGNAKGWERWKGPWVPKPIGVV